MDSHKAFASHLGGAGNPWRMPGRQNRADALDGLRGVAALAVLAFHVWLYARLAPSSAMSSLGDHAWDSGRLGLVLFFALSGYLLYTPWARAALRGRPAPALRPYLVRRAARILPAYYLALAGTFVLLWGSTVPGVRLPPLGSLPLFAVFGQNFSSDTVMTFDPPTWTLAIEVSFYLVLPLLGRLAARPRHDGAARNPISVPLAVIGGGLVWNAVVYLAGLPLPFGKVLPAALPYFGAGMLAAVVAETRRPSPLAARALAAGGALAVVADILVHSGPIGSPPLLFASETVHDLPAALGFAAIVAAAAARGSRALEWRPLVALGTVSYGVYLWNVPIILGLRAAGALPLDPALALPVVLAAAVAVATASWLVIERPAIAWAHSRAKYA